MSSALVLFFVGLLCTTICGVSVYKSTQTLDQWRESGEIPVVDSLVVRDGALSEDWTPFSQSRSTFLVSINNVMFTFFSGGEQPASNLFVEDAPATSFVVQTRAAYHLEEVSVYDDWDSQPDDGE